MLPTPCFVDGGLLRIFLTSLDDHGIGRCGYVDVDPRDPTTILSHAAEPVLDIGEPGTFDDSGVVACSVQRFEDRLFMYYVGFEVGVRIRYRMLTGLAISEDGGRSFRRVSRVPILERSDDELLFRCGPFVMYDGGRFRMWYVAGSEWIIVGGTSKPMYVLKYLESDDGIRWAGRGRAALDELGADEYGFGRPWVKRDDRGYQMFYSVRRRSLDAYRLGYATSHDGFKWHRRDAELGLDVGPGPDDAHAIMYSAVVDLEVGTFCFYNGNEFGRNGVAVARLIDTK